MKSRSEAKPDCPLCELSFPSWQALAWHLVQEHTGLSVGLKRGKWTVNLHRTKKGTVCCWCKSYFELGPNPAPGFVEWAAEHSTSRFARHLERHGGVAAHILEVTLGRP